MDGGLVSAFIAVARLFEVDWDAHDSHYWLLFVHMPVKLPLVTGSAAMLCKLANCT